METRKSAKAKPPKSYTPEQKRYVEIFKKDVPSAYYGTGHKYLQQKLKLAELVAANPTIFPGDKTEYYGLRLVDVESKINIEKQREEYKKTFSKSPNPNNNSKTLKKAIETHKYSKETGEKPDTTKTAKQLEKERKEYDQLKAIKNIHAKRHAEEIEKATELPRASTPKQINQRMNPKIVTLNDIRTPINPNSKTSALEGQQTVTIPKSPLVTAPIPPPKPSHMNSSPLLLSPQSNNNNSPETTPLNVRVHVLPKESKKKTKLQDEIEVSGDTIFKSNLAIPPQAQKAKTSSIPLLLIDDEGDTSNLKPDEDDEDMRRAIVESLKPQKSAVRARKSTVEDERMSDTDFEKKYRPKMVQHIDNKHKLLIDQQDLVDKLANGTITPKEKSKLDNIKARMDDIDFEMKRISDKNPGTYKKIFNDPSIETKHYDELVKEKQKDNDPIAFFFAERGQQMKRNPTDDTNNNNSGGRQPRKQPREDDEPSKRSYFDKYAETAKELANERDNKKHDIKKQLISGGFQIGGELVKGGLDLGKTALQGYYSEQQTKTKGEQDRETLKLQNELLMKAKEFDYQLQAKYLADDVERKRQFSTVDVETQSKMKDIDVDKGKSFAEFDIQKTRAENEGLKEIKQIEGQYSVQKAQQEAMANQANTQQYIGIVKDLINTGGQVGSAYFNRGATQAQVMGGGHGMPAIYINNKNISGGAGRGTTSTRPSRVKKNPTKEAISKAKQTIKGKKSNK
jgi:hypothetical protein